jgi:menaquinol-cytochrome c reductase cytochrome b/c subunit
VKVSSGPAGAEDQRMASRRIEERRAQHKRYKEDVERTGKPFFPYAMFHDTVMSLVVVCVIVGLACVWYFTAEGSTDPGWLGPYYTEEADPGTTNFVPRPDWYFYFLFYLLRIFKWPDTVVLGTVGVPNILLGILIALPFIDLRRERRLSRRPVAIVAAIVVVLAMGTLTYKGATAKESLGSETLQEVPKWAEEQGFADNPEAVAGARLFAVAGCLQCHTYLGSGSSNLGAPDLSDIGSTGKSVAFFQSYVTNPAQFGNQAMPPFATLGEENLHKIAVFLEASKGPKG